MHAGPGSYHGDSPTRAVKIPKFDNQRQRFLTDDECTRLLDELQKKSIETYCFSVLSLDAGLRFSEAAGLTWAMWIRPRNNPFKGYEIRP